MKNEGLTTPLLNSLIARHERALIGNYGKLPAVFVRGRGTTLWDATGKEYLDFFAGFGGTILGHCHPGLIDAAVRQANTLWQVGNQFYTTPQVRLAEQVREKAFDGRMFFCHSGAEAMEAALKLARLAGGPGRTKTISMRQSFHGRTFGALSATCGPAQEGFAPLLPGFVHVPFNDPAALEAQMDSTTSAVIVEPVQGEGGVNMPDQDYLPRVRRLCDQHGATLILDEVWTGVGRTGKYFGHQHYGMVPDIMTLGKALGGGLPVGGILASPRLAAFFKPGTHGCTLGGNPICAAVGSAVFDLLERENLPAHAARCGTFLMDAIRNLPCAGRRIVQVRGLGLFIGVELAIPDATTVVRAALERGLVINVTQKNILRLAPALIVNELQMQRALDILGRVLESV